MLNTNLEVPADIPCLLKLLFLTIDGDDKAGKDSCHNEGGKEL